MTSSKLPPGFLLPFLGQAPLLRHVRPQTIRNLANRRKYHAQATLPQSHTFSSQPSSSGTDTQHGGSQFTAPKASRLKEDFPFPTKKNPSPYEVMHLAHTASAAEIKKRYYRLAFLYHPDSSNHSSASEHFAILNKAYKLLSHESSRSLYNRTGIGWTPGSDSSSPSSPSTGGFGWNDEAMRREARFRNEHQRQSTASSPGQTGWGGADRGGYQYTSARWGHGPQFYDASGLGEQPLGTGTPKYMSNQRFLGTVFVLVSLCGLPSIPSKKENCLTPALPPLACRACSSVSYNSTEPSPRRMLLAIYMTESITSRCCLLFDSAGSY